MEINHTEARAPPGKAVATKGGIPRKLLTNYAKISHKEKEEVVSFHMIIVVVAGIAIIALCPSTFAIEDVSQAELTTIDCTSTNFMSPPPLAAIDSLVAHGYLSASERTLLLNLYYDPNGSDGPTFENPWSLIQRLWKIAGDVCTALEVLKWAGEVCSWMEGYDGPGGGFTAPLSITYQQPMNQ